jgi:hypothetical protein
MYSMEVDITNWILDFKNEVHSIWVIWTSSSQAKVGGLGQSRGLGQAQGLGQSWG